MHPELQHLPVNWVDGMKITKNHLNELSNAAFDAIRDAQATGLTDFNFGLLPMASSSESVELYVDEERIELQTCRAITRGGVRIEILGKSRPAVVLAIKGTVKDSFFTSDNEWLLMLKAFPFKRKPVGEPDEAESPMRLPFTEPTYELELVPIQQARSVEMAAFAVPLAKIRYERQGISRVADYIPPCTRVECSRELVAWHKNFETQLRDSEKLVWDIIRKIHHKRRENDSNRLAEDIFQLCEKMTEYISATYDDYRLFYLQLSPLHTIAYFVKLARNMNCAIKLAQEKDTMIEYFRYYIGNFQAGTFEERVEMLSNLQYNHLDCAESLTMVNGFLQELATLFQQLTRLDYRTLAKNDAILGVHKTSPQPTGWQPHPTTTPGPPQKRGGMVIKEKGDPKKGDWFDQ